MIKIGITILACTFLIEQSQGQSQPSEVPIVPAESNSQEPGKTEWKGYDKRKSYTRHTISPTGKEIISSDSLSILPDSSIHSLEWVPEKSSIRNTPCANAKPPINF